MFWHIDQPSMERTIEVDEIVSSEPFTISHTGGAVTYMSDPETGEVITILSGRAAATAIMSPLLQELNFEMNPSPENHKTPC